MDIRRVPMGVDPYKPNSARSFNYMLGGKDYYAADMQFAEGLLKVAPDSKALAQMSRRFLLHGVRLSAEAGIRQFIDIGAGIPFSPSVHEVASKVDPSTRVISIDFDPVVYAHATAMLSGTSGEIPMLADLRHPADIIDRLRTDALIDFTEPVAILMVGVLHFVMDEEHPAEVIAHLRDTMAPGSHLVFTHVSNKSDPYFIQQIKSATRGSPSQPAVRSSAEIACYLEGFTIVTPGLAPIQDWLDDGSPTTRAEILGCICHKP